MKTLVKTVVVTVIVTVAAAAEYPNMEKLNVLERAEMLI